MTKETYLAWLIHMASQPGGKAYAWARAKELSAHPVLTEFKGIDQDLKRAMTQRSQS